MSDQFSLCSLRPLWCIIVALMLATPVHAQRDLKDIPPPDPELERQTFVLPEGFEVNLFAADPQIAKPIQMNFDPQGRLWIAGSSTYPQVAPGEEADDRVLILEDSDGDGVSDKTTVFADGLLIPTGVIPGDGGAYVANSTELLHLSDTDGDGKADRRRVVLSGFGTEDTHHILHTFRWGPAQRLHMLQSIYIHSHVETPRGVERLNAGGIWQFRPDTWELDVFAKGWVNAWGLHWLPYGSTFVTDGAGGEGINYAVPDAYYATAYGAPRILQGLNPGSPKHCGLEVVTGRHLPDDWQNSLITCDFRGHRVCRFTLTERGSGYVSQEQQELIKSDHVAFRPIDVKMGPDGAIYIADWYNPIIQHGEVDFRDPRRDHTHGRIWRVTYTGNDLLERPDLVAMSDAELCEQLAAPEMWTREQARRLLKERGPGVLDTVNQWARSLDNSTDDYHRHRLEALWVYASHRGHSDNSVGRTSKSVQNDGADDEFSNPSHGRTDLEVRPTGARLSFEEELLRSLLRCHDHNARAGATRVLGDWHEDLGNVFELLAPLVGDEHPRVRLEAVCVLRKIRDPRSIELAMRALDPSMDPRSARDGWGLLDPDLAEPYQPVELDEWLEYALWQTARELQPVWQPALLSGEIDFGGDTHQLAFVLRSAGSAETVPVLTRLLGEGAVPADQQAEAVAVVGQYAGPPQLAELLQLAAASDDAALASACLQTLLDVHARRKLQPDAPAEPLSSLLSADEPRVLELAARAVGAWQVGNLRRQIEAIAADDQAAPGLRRAAVDGIAAFADQPAIDLLVGLSTDDQPHHLRQAAVIALLRTRPQQGLRGALALLQQPEGADDLGPLFAELLGRKQGIGQLIEALRDEAIPADVAVIGLRAIGSSGQQLPEFAAALEKAGGITSGPKKLSPEEMQALIAEVEFQGNPAAGESVYRRRELNCIQCHAIGGAGGNVGPDMISLGTTAQLDYIIDALLDPNKQIKENYHTMIVLDQDGRTYSGILVRQTDEELLLRDAEGKEQAVPLDSIEQTQQGVSLMPAGLLDKLTRSELVDLVAFLKALGRLPEFTVGKQPLVRNWEVMQPTDQAAHRLRRVSYAIAASDDPAFVWLPLTTNVAGTLPLEEMPTVSVNNRSAPGTRGVAFLRTHLETTGSEVTLSFGDVTGLTAWWDDQPLELAEQMTIPTSADRHRLTLAVDLGERTQNVRVERIATGE
jgi:putative heme-binding domain-containing protein